MAAGDGGALSIDAFTGKQDSATVEPHEALTTEHLTRLAALAGLNLPDDAAAVEKLRADVNGMDRFMRWIQHVDARHAPPLRNLLFDLPAHADNAIKNFDDAGIQDGENDQMESSVDGRVLLKQAARTYGGAYYVSASGNPSKDNSNDQ